MNPMDSPLAAQLRALSDGIRLDPALVSAALAADPAAAEAMLTLEGRVEGLRQRSAELRAVMSSTRDLLSMPDADLMLQRIVDRAHELVDIDITYLSVYDADHDELYVRAASGTTSPRFLAMVVPAGVGVASLAVHTRQPQWVEDYASVTSVPHDPTIDAIIGEEQLRSLLGAPLVVGDEVLGVLFAASRDARSFRPDEVSLLAEFAGHAALALHFAQLLKQAQDATAEAASRQREAEWAAALHGELTGMVVAGHGADAVVTALADALGRRVCFVDGDAGTITDSRAVPTATESDSAEEPPLTAAARRGLRPVIAAAAASGRGIDLDDGPISFVAPVVTAAERAGALLIRRSGRDLSPVERRTIERSASTLALLMLRRDALADAEEQVRGELAAELLDTPARRRAAVRRAASRGLGVDEPWIALAVPADAESRRRISERARRRAHALVAPHPDGITVLLPGAHAVDLEMLLVDLSAPVAAVASADGLDAAAAQAESLWRSARIAQGLGLTGAVTGSVLAPYALLFDGDAARLRGFVDGMLGPVLEWDEARGTDLFETLSALFDAHWSPVAAARSLQVHASTVKQRLQRLRLLLADDLDSGEARFRLELALRIERARRLLERT